MLAVYHGQHTADCSRTELLACTEEPERRCVDTAKVVLSGLAAAVLLQSAYVPSAEAGVVIEKSKNKKVRALGTASASMDLAGLPLSRLLQQLDS